MTVILWAILAWAANLVHSQECPPDYTFCSNQGETCFTTNNETIIAFGANVGSEPYWAYRRVLETGNLNCTIDSFGGAISLIQNVPKICCAIDGPLGPTGALFPTDPVIGVATCNGRFSQWVSDTDYLPNYWRFELNQYATVTFANCFGLQGDTDWELRVYNETGFLYNDLDSIGCDGDDCGICLDDWYDAEGEEFTMIMAPGVYWIETDDESGNLNDLDIMCKFVNDTTDCPAGYSFCSARGQTCSSTSGQIIAYGLGEFWTYAESDGADFTCSDPYFEGDPAPAAIKQCCIADEDLSTGFSGNGIVVGEASCGDSLLAVFVRDTDIEFNYRFTLTEPTKVTLSNCETWLDTEMGLYNLAGDDIMDSLDACDGDDCGYCDDYNGEQITTVLGNGTYFIQIFPNSDDMPYHLDITCEPVVVNNCPDGYTLLCNEGDDCRAGMDRDGVVAYGYGPLYAFEDIGANASFTCDDSTFGDPSPFLDEDMQCCIPMVDFAGNFSRTFDPVILDVFCDQFIETYVTSSTPVDFCYRLKIDQLTTVHFDNCLSDGADTNIEIYNETGFDLTDYMLECDGDDCGRCEGYDREEFPIQLAAGTYFVCNDADDEGVYRLNISCFDVPNNCPDDFEFCALRGDACSVSDGQTVAFGSLNRFNFIQADSTGDITCTGPNFGGNPVFTDDNKFCCRATRNFQPAAFDATAAFVGEMGCDIARVYRGAFTENNCGPYNWLLNITETTFIRLDNCDTPGGADTELYLYFANGTEFDDPGGCSGDDCYCNNLEDPDEVREIIQLLLFPGTYIVQMDINSCDEPIHYKLNLDCVSFSPTLDPTRQPTLDPTRDPTLDPTFHPSRDPTSDPTTDPTRIPTFDPTLNPTQDPTFDPTSNPTRTRNPSMMPTATPTSDPTANPTERCPNCPFNISYALTAEVPQATDDCEGNNDLCIPPNGRGVEIAEGLCEDDGRRNDDGQIDDVDTVKWLAPKVCVRYDISGLSECGNVTGVFLTFCDSGSTYDIDDVGETDVENVLNPQQTNVAGINAVRDGNQNLGLQVEIEDPSEGFFRICFKNVIVDNSFGTAEGIELSDTGGTVYWLSEDGENSCDTSDGLPCYDFYFGCPEELEGPEDPIIGPDYNCDCDDGMTEVTIQYTGGGLVTRVVIGNDADERCENLVQMAGADTYRCTAERMGRDEFEDRTRFYIELEDGTVCRGKNELSCDRVMVGERVFPDPNNELPAECDNFIFVSHVDGDGALCDEDALALPLPLR